MRFIDSVPDKEISATSLGRPTTPNHQMPTPSLWRPLVFWRRSAPNSSNSKTQHSLCTNDWKAQSLWYSLTTKVQLSVPSKCEDFVKALH